MFAHGRHRPSPATLLAVIALVFAVAGTAIAAPQGGRGTVTKSKVKKIARKQITKAAPGLSVAAADSPHARALVRLEPLQVELARNVAQAQVDNPRVGYVCFDLDFVPTGAQATNETEGQDDDAVLSAVIDPLSRQPRGSAFNACEPGTDLQVLAIDPTTSTSVNTSFFLEIWR